MRIGDNCKVKSTCLTVPPSLRNRRGRVVEIERRYSRGLGTWIETFWVRLDNPPWGDEPFGFYIQEIEEK